MNRASRESRASREHEPEHDHWIKAPASQQYMQVLGRTVRHLRACGVMDVAHGAHELSGGTFRLHYLVTPFADTGVARSPMRRCFDGIVLGVCDARAWTKEEKLSLRAEETKHGAFEQGGHSVAWGLRLSTGQLVSTSNVSKAGIFEGPYSASCAIDNASLLLPGSGDEHHAVEPWWRTEHGAERMAPRARLLAPMTERRVVVEVHVPVAHPSDRRTHASHSLHPSRLTCDPTKRNLEQMMAVQAPIAGSLDDCSAARRPWLAFSVDGGAFVEARHMPRMPPAVFPWVALSRGGDSVTLERIEMQEP